MKRDGIKMHFLVYHADNLTEYIEFVVWKVTKRAQQVTVLGGKHRAHVNKVLSGILMVVVI